MRVSIAAAALLGASLVWSRSLEAGERPVADPCLLVTKSDAKALLGAAVTSAVEAQRIAGDPNRMCTFRAANGRLLNVYVGSKKKADFDAEKAGRKPVAGVGDEAYLNPPNIITFRKGSKGVSVQAMGFDAAHDASLLPKLRTLARALARRL
jgi:hypothetical protein